MKNFGNSSRGHSQGVPKIFRASTYRAHCAVIFAIAQLYDSCEWWTNFFMIHMKFLTDFIHIEIYTASHGFPATARLLFYRAKLRVARYCQGKLSVRLSVCPSVTLRYRDHIRWNSAKIISRLISLTISLSADPNMMDILQMEHPKV